jgi:hypothetical protein
VIYEPLSVGDTVCTVRTDCRTVDTCRSRVITALGTYHGASVMIRSTFDWNLSRMSIVELDVDPHNCIP